MHFKEYYKYIKPQEYIEKFLTKNWYIDLQHELYEYFYSYNGIKENKTIEWLGYRKEFVKMVVELLNSDMINLANSGKNWDEERKGINSIIIHHSGTLPDIPISAINALSLIRLYAPIYSQKSNDQFGLPIWSNHFYDNKITFIPYHYIIEQNGKINQILEDSQIGWHAGNWQVNCSSIAICFLDNLLNKTPTHDAIQSARNIIQKYKNTQIFGHKEINNKTTCPGELFFGEDGWKKLLT